MLAGVVVATRLGVQATVFYLAVYLFMNMAAFAVIVARERETDLGDSIDAVAGLGRERPWLAWPMTISMLALAGHPRDGRVHRQVLPDRRGRLRRLHLAGRRDRDRLDDLARLLPAGDRGDVDARGAGARTRRPRRPRSAGLPALAGGSPELDGERTAPAAALAGADEARLVSSPQPEVVLVARPRGGGHDLLRDHPPAAVRPRPPRRRGARRAVLRLGRAATPRRTTVRR